MAGLIIRQEQFEMWRKERFVSWLVREVRTDYAQRVNGLPEHRVGAMVRHGLRRAQAYGLAGEPALAEFVFTMFQVSPVFDEYPAIRRILLDPAVPEELKIQETRQRMTAEDWNAAQRTYRTAYPNADAAWSALPILRNESKERN
jgi:hypothetical protein